MASVLGGFQWQPPKQKEIPRCIRCGKLAEDMSAEEIFLSQRIESSPTWGETAQLMCPSCQKEMDRAELEELQTHEDFRVLVEDLNNQEWDGPDGPRTRPIILRVFAAGREWSREHAPYFNRAQAIRNYFYPCSERTRHENDETLS